MRAAITYAGVTLFLSLMSRTQINTGLRAWEAHVGLGTLVGSRLPMLRQDAATYRRGGVTGGGAELRTMAKRASSLLVSTVPSLTNPGSDRPVDLGMPLRD